MQSVVDRCVLQIRGHAPDADAFGDRATSRGLESSVTNVLVQAAAWRIGQYAADRLPAGLEIFRHAREGSTGATCRYKGVDATVGLSPDLRARGLHVCFTVRGVVELVRPDRTGE